MKSLLGLFDFSSKPDRVSKPTGPNRRQSIRYGADAEIAIGWWEGDDFQRVVGALLDISQGGAAVVVSGQHVPPEGTAHMLLAEDGGADWLDVIILSIRREPAGPVILHLQFVGDGSYAFFRSALPGTDLGGRGIAYESGEYDPRDWR
ncbi:PilZ domain-containing protein [Tautonia rosea]|uniref:PilZ domain-containing protein n=1 Tax=Tautonia rosea TaxID=2728037 RepID=UPI0014751D26|nr:PilZ domain-containing protein [Tautonia rosea]